MSKQLLGKIDAPLFKRQRLALIQAIEDSPHPLRTELLNGLLDQASNYSNKLLEVHDEMGNTKLYRPAFRF